MRLDNFIIESSQVDPYNMVAEVYHRSLPYLMELLKEFHHIDMKTPMLLSGRKSSDAIINKPIRENRHPKDTNIDAHIFVDDVFFNIFGIRARSNSIFVTGKYSVANSYGDSVYGIFPNGNNYEIIWSERINDMYSDMLDSSEYRYLGQPLEYMMDDLLDGYNDIYDNARETLTSNFYETNDKDDYKTEDEYMEALDDYVESRVEEYARELAREEAERTKENDEDSFIDTVRSDYKKGNLKQAILSNNEIMLSGTSYTGVRYDYLPYLLRYMEVHKTKKPTPHLFASAMVGVDFRMFPNHSDISINAYRKRITEYLKTIDMSDLKK